MENVRWPSSHCVEVMEYSGVGSCVMWKRCCLEWVVFLCEKDGIARLVWVVMLCQKCDVVQSVCSFVVWEMCCCG